MTAFNRENYIAQAIESVLNSTLTDFELLIVDDQSHDRTVEIAASYSNADPRIKLHVNTDNLGDYPNRNYVASLAVGKYLKFLDSDDLIYRHSLAIYVEAMEASPGAALGLGHSAPEDEVAYPWMLYPKEVWEKRFLGKGCLDCGPSGTIIRRDAFLEIGAFGKWGVLSDTDLWLRMSAKWPIVLLPPGLIWWRRHEQQEFTKDNAATFYLSKGFELTMQALSSDDCPLSEVQRLNAITRKKQHHARRLLSLALRERHPALAWEVFLHSGLTINELFTGLHPYS
jgi:glycosyltransferase involved in cell wall biosynthesis